MCQCVLLLFFFHVNSSLHTINFNVDKNIILFKVSYTLQINLLLARMHTHHLPNPFGTHKRPPHLQASKSHSRKDIWNVGNSWTDSHTVILAEIITPASADYEYRRDRLLNQTGTTPDSLCVGGVSWWMRGMEGGREGRGPIWWAD